MKAFFERVFVLGKLLISRLLNTLVARHNFKIDEDDNSESQRKQNLSRKSKKVKTSRRRHLDV